MQASKPRNGSSEVPQRTSPTTSKSKGSSEVPQRTTPATPKSNGSSEIPQKTSPGTSKSTHVKKTGGAGSESASSKSTPTKTPIDRSPKANERRSPRSPVTERRRVSKVAELEYQLTQLQEDLKKTKDQLGTSESGRRRIQHEAEEVKKQLSAMTAKVEDSQLQLMEFSAAEEARLQELRKISQDRDRAWESELEATHKQNSVDSAALIAAMSEIYRLKQQLGMVVKSEAAQAKGSETVHSELMELKQEMAETLRLVDELKAQLKNSEEAEAEAQEIVHDTQQQLEMAMTTIEALRLDGSRLLESFNAKSSELEEVRAQVTYLDENMKKLQASQHTVEREDVPDKHLEKTVHGLLESEMEHLRSALEAAEVKYQEAHVQSTRQIQSAYESAECARIDSGLREAELESALKNAKAEIFELKASLIDKETELQSILEMNRELTAEIDNREVHQTDTDLEAKLAKSIADVVELKANLLDKETEVQGIVEENELLKAETGKRVTDSRKSFELAITEVELARAAEQDALMRLECVAEEADKNSRRAARVADQLEAAQTANSEMEAELRRLRVQSDQWRKAAEAAAAALSPGNGQFVERTCSMDTEYQSVAGKLMSSPFSDDLDDESPKKKNVMRRISGLWKKSPK